MRFIDSIQFKENPPSEYKVEGSLWSQNDRLYHKDHSGVTHTLSYLSDFAERRFIYNAPVASYTHVIEHGLGSENLLLSFQDASSGSPREYLEVNVEPTPGNEAMSITVYLDESIKLFASLVRP